MTSCTWHESSIGCRPLAAGVDPKFLHRFHCLPVSANLTNASGGTTIPIQFEQHPGRQLNLRLPVC